MSLCDRWWHGVRLCLLAVLGVVLVGCQGVDEQNQLDAIGSIGLEAAENRLQQIFNQALSRYIRLSAQANTRYRLTTQFDSDEDETSTSITLDYVLYDEESGAQTLAGDISVIASFGGVTSLYTRETSRQFAHEQLAMQLAERLYLRLLAHFSHQS